MTRAAKATSPGSLGEGHCLPPRRSPALLLPALPSKPPPVSPPTSQHGLLLLGRADEAADALDDLALGIYLLFSRFLAQEDGGNYKVSTTTLVTACRKVTPSSLSFPPAPLPVGRGDDLQTDILSPQLWVGRQHIPGSLSPAPSRTGLSLGFSIVNCIARTWDQLGL